MKSCMGYILEVDLTTREIKKTKVPDEVYYNLLSGMGLAAWYCLKEIPEGADPLGPDNVLGIVSGAMTGSGALFSGRWMAIGKSPLTGGWGDANCGGMFAPAIKQCGVDGIFFKGISETPVYLYMDNKVCELRDATPYWGMDATEAEKQLKKDNTSKKIPEVALIGQAGENCSCIAGICTGAGRIAARQGLGGVMGSKRLKAVVLAGTKPIPCADKEKVRDLSSALGRRFKGDGMPDFIPGTALGLGGVAMGMNPLAVTMDGSMQIPILRRWGTPMNTPMAIRSGDAPLLNWKGTPQDVKGSDKKLNPDVTLKRETNKYHCYACPMGCGGELNIKDIRNGEFAKTHKPEYETINQIGTLCGNDDFDSILYINELLNRAGMDSISCGGTIAFAIECYENGILTKEDTDGLELTWGNSESIIALVKKMIARDGFGDVLADGSKKAAERIGKGSARYAMHVGGQEPAAHDSRNDQGLAIAYQAEPAPGKHTVAMDLMYGTLSVADICSWAPPATFHMASKDLQATREHALTSVANACYTCLMNGAGWCYYVEMMGTHTLKPVEYLNAASGWDRDGDDYMEIGKRIQTMKQMFNVKQGIAPRSVKLPNRMLGYPALPSGPLKGAKLPHQEEKIERYYEVFGWDPKTGVPTAETVHTLNIDQLLAMEV